MNGDDWFPIYLAGGPEEHSVNGWRKSENCRKARDIAYEKEKSLSIIMVCLYGSPSSRNVALLANITYTIVVGTNIRWNTNPLGYRLKLDRD